MNPKLPLNVRYDPDQHLFVWKPIGVIDEAVVNEIIVFLAHQEGLARTPFDRFTDLSAQEAVELTFKYVFHVALYRRLSYAGRSAVKSAFYVTHPQAVHLVKIHALLTDHSPLNVEMFEELEAAAKWLGVPVEALAAP